MSISTEWIGLFLTLVALLGGAIWGTVKLLVKLGSVITSLDGLTESLQKLSNDVEQWRETQSEHGERIATLEGRGCGRHSRESA